MRIFDVSTFLLQPAPMARIARVAVPGLPHHVTQWCNRRQKVFFSAADYALYRDLLAPSCRKAKVECWGRVAMPNHVHLILTPRDADGLRAALAPAHRAYTGLMTQGASAPGISGGPLWRNGDG